MKNSFILLGIALYIPIFIKLNDFGSHNFKLIVFFFIGLLLLHFILKKDSNKLNNDYLLILKPFIRFNLLFMGLTILQVVYYYENYISEIQALSIYMMGYISSITIILFLSNYAKRHISIILHNLSYVIGIMFIIQLGLSAYESINNIYLIESDGIWLSEYVDEAKYVKRSILPMMGVDISMFHFPFTGMLSQWNHWGTQLPFYNLFFLYMIWKGKKFFLPLIFLVIIASVMNTTRVGLASILITDYLFYSRIFRRRNKLIPAMWLIIFFVSLFLGEVIYKNISEYLSSTDTLTSRILAYPVFLSYALDNFSSTLIGFGYREAGKLNIIFGQGFESQIFSTLFYSGLLGLYLVTVFFTRVWIHGNRLPSSKRRFFNKLIILNMLGVSLTLNMVFTIHTFPFVTLIYIMNSLSDNPQE